MSFVIDEGSEGPLTTATRQILDRFTRVINILESDGSLGSNLSHQAALTDALERFQLWSGSVGAAIDGQKKISLEWRLREAPDIKEEIQDIQRDMLEALEDLHAICIGQRQNRTREADTIQLDVDSDGEEVHVDVAALDEAQGILDVILECVKSLLRLSILIRKASPRDRWNRALQKPRNDRWDDHFDIRHVSEKFPKLNKPENDWLRIRLGRAITQRRQFIRYCRDHKHHLSGQDTYEHVPGTNAGQFLRAGINELPDMGVVNKALTLQPPKTEASTQASTLQVTTLEAIRGEDYDDAVSVVSSVVSSLNPLGEDDEVIHLPTLQAVSNGHDEFECPFCFTLQSIRNSRKWKKHAFGDLKPFVCTGGKGECDLELFADRNTWFTHELDHHRHQWVCSLCQRDPYDSLPRFRAHIQKAHSEIPIGHLADIAKLCQRPLQFIPALDCPFCDEFDAKLREVEVKCNIRDAPQPEVILVPTPTFRRHVASHLEQLALFAIGTQQISDESTKSGSVESHARLSVRDADILQHYLDDQSDFDSESDLDEQDKIERQSSAAGTRRPSSRNIASDMNTDKIVTVEDEDEESINEDSSVAHIMDDGGIDSSPALSPGARETLEAWLSSHAKYPYPTELELEDLSVTTGLNGRPLRHAISSLRRRKRAASVSRSTFLETVDETLIPCAKCGSKFPIDDSVCPQCGTSNSAIVGNDEQRPQEGDRRSQSDILVPSPRETPAEPASTDSLDRSNLARSMGMLPIEEHAAVRNRREESPISDMPSLDPHSTSAQHLEAATPVLTTEQRDLQRLRRQLKSRPGMPLVQLNLDHVGRQIIYRGNVQRLNNNVHSRIDTHAILLDNYLILAKPIGHNDDIVYDVSRLPIPMDLLQLVSLGTAPSPYANNPSFLYPFAITHLGKETYTLFTPSDLERLNWHNSIIAAKTKHAKSLRLLNAEPFKLRVIVHLRCGDINDGFNFLVTEETPLDRALAGFSPWALAARDSPRCAASLTWEGQRYIIMGSEDGLHAWAADYHKWRTLFEFPTVTQVDVLEEFSLFLVLSDGSLLAFSMKMLSVQRGRRLSDNIKLSGTGIVKFFRIWKHPKGIFIIYSKENGSSSSFQVLEAVHQPQKAAKKSKIFQTSRSTRGSLSESFRVYDEFHIPCACFDLTTFNTSIAIATAHGFEVLNLEKKQPFAVPDLKRPECATIASRLKGQRPLAMLRLSGTEFLCCYEQSAVYVNQHGDISRSVIMEFVGNARRAVLRDNLLLLFNDEFVEIRNANNGGLKQVIEGKDLRLIDDGRRITEDDTIKFTMRNPKDTWLQLVLEMLPDDQFKDDD